MARTPSPGLPAPDLFELEAETLRALAHPKRLAILDRLGSGRRSVTELAGALGMTLPNASQHLRVLRDHGVVRAERDGQVVRYRLVSPELSSCCTMVRRVIVEGRLRLGAPAPTSGRMPVAPVAA